MGPSLIIELVRDIFKTKDFIPLHAPFFIGKEQAYVSETIESTFVSSVGEFVNRFERDFSDYTKGNHATATVNGTAALHLALHVAGAKRGDFVITQAATFVATCNAIAYTGAEPVFVDVSRQSLGLCPNALSDYLDMNAVLDDNGLCIDKQTRRRYHSVIPMHTFGHPVQLDEILSVCKKWNLILVEDSAESLGSKYKGKHTGTIGDFGAFSFNGNKIITTGGGGMLLSRHEENGKRAKHLSTTAKIPHKYDFIHDEVGFNYRMPNLNAALGCAQLETLDLFISKKRELALQYEAFFKDTDFIFVKEPSYAESNYWLNAIICESSETKQQLLTELNDAGIMSRPLWGLMHKLPIHRNNKRGELHNSEWLEQRLINIPSSPPLS